MRAVADAHPAVSIGCYPFNYGGALGANLVLRSEDAGALAAATAALRDVIVARQPGGARRPEEPA
jgi:hypothetical protein